MTTLVEFRDVTVGYDRTPVLEHVTFSIGAGELWFWLGPNGSGKTTLAKALLGALRPLSGQVRLAVPRDRTGYVPQRSEWNPSLPTTAGEFVELGLCGTLVTQHARNTRVAKALVAVDMGGRESQDYARLSGGQRQRVLLARALTRDPQLLVLDEPTTGLDVASEAALLAIVTEQVLHHGAAAVFVSHRHDLAITHATHRALFAHGRVTAEARA